MHGLFIYLNVSIKYMWVFYAKFARPYVIIIFFNVFLNFKMFANNVFYKQVS